MVRLWTIRVSSVQVHSHLVQFDARAQRIWQSPFVILNPQTGNRAGVWMTSCPEKMVQRIWEFRKRVSWDMTIEARPVFWPLKDVVGFFRSLPTENLNITRRAVRWVWWGQHSKNFVSLSSCRHGPKSKINKSVCITVEIDIIIAIQHIIAFTLNARFLFCCNLNNKANNLLKYCKTFDSG